MNHILLFESFLETSYVWPDARFWLEKLHPEELCFLAIYNDIIKTENPRFQKEKPLFEMINDSTTYSLDPDFYDEDEGKASFELLYQVPCGKEYCNIYADVEAKGGFGPYTPATYMEPAEGGESILESIEIENFSYINSDDTFEAIFTDSSYVFKSDIIDKKKLISALEYAAMLRVEFYEDETNITKPTMPDKLMEKCESIRKSMQSVVKGASVINRIIGDTEDGTK